MTANDHSPKDLLAQLLHHSDQNTHAKPHIRGETALWRAVITQALMDASSNSLKSEAVYHRTEALRWLTGTSADFVLVCDYAGMDASYVRRMVKKALHTNCKWRADAGQATRSHRAKPNVMTPTNETIQDPLPAQALILPFVRPRLAYRTEVVHELV